MSPDDVIRLRHMADSAESALRFCQGRTRADLDTDDNAVRRSLGESNFYDPGNPDLRHLQRYEEAVANLPMDDNGFPDWMRALRESNIQPRAGLKPDAPMNILNLDVIMKNTREMPFVSFPHYAHTLWLDCGIATPPLSSRRPAPPESP